MTIVIFTNRNCTYRHFSRKNDVVNYNIHSSAYSEVELLCRSIGVFDIPVQFIADIWTYFPFHNWSFRQEVVIVFINDIVKAKQNR